MNDSFSIGTLTIKIQPGFQAGANDQDMPPSGHATTAAIGECRQLRSVSRISRHASSPEISVRIPAT